MKKVVFILTALLLFSWLLVAVESEPSEIVGYVRYDLVEGLNMIALPMELPEEWTMAGDLGTAVGANLVTQWDAEGQEFVSTSLFNENWLDNFPIQLGMPLMVSVAEEGAFYSLGKLPEEVLFYELVPGLNTIMVVLDRTDLDMAGDLGTEIGANLVTQWDAEGQEFVSASLFNENWLDDFPIQIGMPLMVSVSEQGVWPEQAPAILQIQNNTRRSSELNIRGQ